MGEEKLKVEFSAFGTVTLMAVQEDRKGRKFAFVNVDTSEEAHTCVEAIT